MWARYLAEITACFCLTPCRRQFGNPNQLLILILRLVARVTWGIWRFSYQLTTSNRLGGAWILPHRWWPVRSKEPILNPSASSARLRHMAALLKQFHTRGCNAKSRAGLVVYGHVSKPGDKRRHVPTWTYQETQETFSTRTAMHVCSLLMIWNWDSGFFQCR